MASPQETREADGIKANRYRRIEEEIKFLTGSNITQKYEAVLEILAEGEISRPTEGTSIGTWLTFQVNYLYEEPSFAKLVKVLLPLEPYLSTCLMEMISSMMDDTVKRENKCLLDLTTLLVQEGANPFHKFYIWLNLANNDSSLLPSLWAFLEATFSKWGVSNTNFLNDVIKGVPSQLLEDDSSHAIKELIVKECLNMIETNPAVCDHADEKGKTPLHNLMEKLLLDGLWKRMPKLVAATDIIWDLLSQMITEKNVNAKDKDQVTPYTLLLLWQDSISDFQPTDASNQQNLEKNEKVKNPIWKSLKEKVKEIDIQLFQKKGARKDDELHKMKSVLRYRRIEEKIESLTTSNITRQYEAILEILAKGEISPPREGISIGKRLAWKVVALWEEPTYAMLVKVLLPLEPDLSTSLMEMIASRMDYTGERKKKGLLDLTTLLVQEGANPFHLKSVFHYCLEYADNHSSVLPSLLAFLEATFSKWGACNTKFLNDVIKGVPSQIFEGDSCCAAAIKEFIVRNCLKVIEANLEVCDHVDEEGKTPLHNLMEKLDDLWKRMPKLVATTDIIWDLLSQMITEKNINYKDKDQVTPYTWILLWQDLISDVQPTDDSNQQNLEKNEKVKNPEWKSLKEKVKEIDTQLFQKKGARKEDALQNIKSVQERHLEGLARKLLVFDKILKHRLVRSERPCTEIMAELEREAREDIETVRDLKRKGCGECLGRLSKMKEFKDFCFEPPKTCNKQMLQINIEILQILISESNAQAIFNFINFLRMHTKEQFSHTIKYLFEQCIDKHAFATKDDFHYLLNIKIVSRNETLLPALRVMDLLIQSYRNNGNSDPIEIYLNPMQDLYQVKEDFRLVAHRVIKGAYCTLNNCLESESVINTLLFLGCGGNDCTNATIKECLEAADGLQQRDITDSSSLFLSSKELTRELFKGNYCCLKRSVLHLLAIFVHDKEVLKQIPKEFIEKWKDERDIQGCTPLHIAHLHGNQSFISFLASHEVKLVTDYFGRTPESFADPYEYCEGYYTEHCQNITTAKSSVFDTMKEMLVLPINECEAIEDNFKILFERIIAHDGFPDAYIQIAGSVREKLKVGRFNEVDLQICIRRNDSSHYSTDSDDIEFFIFHESLVKNMGKIGWEEIFLRPVSFSWHSPWKFIWEKKGRYNGLVISVDVVPILVDNEELVKEERQQLLINNAPDYKQLKRWHVVKKDTVWSLTVCMQEWDILDNVPPGCRLGILIAKALLEVQDQVNENDDLSLKAPITSYVIKNAVFWILSGKTQNIKEEHGNVIRERYGHLQQQLDFKGTRPTWTTEEDLERYGEEGRFWAETIFNAIHMLARNYEQKFDSFINPSPHEYERNDLESQQVYDVMQTCEKCLERLRKEVFFDEQTIEDETHQVSS